MVAVSGHLNSAEHDKSVRNGFLAFADNYIAGVASPDGLAWFRKAVNDIAATPTDKGLEVAVGLAPRRLGKADISLADKDLANLELIHKRLDLQGWSVDQLARVALMLAGFDGDAEAFANRFDTFCTTADVGELIALYRGLPVYPAATLLEPRAREGIRSGMKPVFEAVAHRNPYPVDHFSEDAWNQMVVKAFFIGSTVWPIQNFDERANPLLAAMLVGLAQERWAAGRPVSAELWRCVVPFAEEEGIGAVVHAFANGHDTDRLAVACALRRTGPATAAILKRISLYDDVAKWDARLTSEKIGWSDFAS